MILALDFDGVLCDSASETAASAWRAGKTVWPHWLSPEPPEALITGFRAVRPYLETGYQAIPMLRMVEQNRPLDAFKSDLETEINSILAETNLTRRDMITRFGEARDNWIADNEASWLARHRFFPGTVERVRERINKGDNVAIVTTKQERFVHSLLNDADLTIHESHIFGLERKKSKEEILTQLLDIDTSIIFVEDRLETLIRIIKHPSLAQATLQYADWGYGTPDDLIAARNTPRITVTSLETFLM